MLLGFLFFLHRLVPKLRLVLRRNPAPISSSPVNPSFHFWVLGFIVAFVGFVSDAFEYPSYWLRIRLLTKITLLHFNPILGLRFTIAMRDSLILISGKFALPIALPMNEWLERVNKSFSAANRGFLHSFLKTSGFFGYHLIGILALILWVVYWMSWYLL